ncbi:hypothetical protein VTI74DRAFT_2816 [Chaetomium olivicolor]
MTDRFDLGNYTVPYDKLPGVLWRVTHGDSQHRRDPKFGELVAADYTHVFTDEDGLRKAAANHFKWSCREKSCFVSAFSDKQHAVMWAQRRKSPVYITPIVTSGLKVAADYGAASVHIFDATELSKRLDIPHEYSKHEFIFLHRIPCYGLGRVRRLDETPTQDCRDPLTRLVNTLNDLFVTFWTREKSTDMDTDMKSLISLRDMETHVSQSRSAMDETVQVFKALRISG